MSIVDILRPVVAGALKDLYQKDFAPAAIAINTTKPEFEGDYTVVLFSLVKELKKSRKTSDRK